MIIITVIITQFVELVCSLKGCKVKNDKVKVETYGITDIICIKLQYYGLYNRVTELYKLWKNYE